MAKTCSNCNGSGWYGPRTDLGRSLGYKSGGPCRRCGGSGLDPHWSEKPCRCCGSYFEYNIGWSNIPDYCESCRAWKYKPCANKHCHGTVKFKAFWDKVSDYCECKGWYEIKCPNSHCNGTIRINSSWDNPPKFCKECKGWYEKPCANHDCSNTVRFHSEWSVRDVLCDSCKEQSRDKIAKTRLANNGHPDHTTYSYGGLTRSFDSDKGENVRHDHIHPTGDRGDSKDRE